MRFDIYLNDGAYDIQANWTVQLEKSCQFWFPQHKGYEHVRQLLT